MGLFKELSQKDAAGIGQELHQFDGELYPICQIITGDGVRQTSALIQEHAPLRTLLRGHR